MDRSSAGKTERRETYLTTKQVSTMTGIPEGTLRFWRHTGDGPRSHTLGRKRVVYPLSGLNDWLAAQESNNVRGGVA
ncbi:helix-turn-helix transcriptional regulator [Rhodococcus sp. SGAir0479]|uniref:helix-turn-helix transcriptional regulator n=1 Tax=Rhodococcus sp. SGAir0479 TaxID=2567884 RepID=UPI0010CD0876|nr:helix-turn-helix domain-containing protein [Rhodococcus sp. SGAir0479]QCQ94043.1 DNA-binding protein [Rhodococcus sp. SGAir0479]